MKKTHRDCNLKHSTNQQNIQLAQYLNVKTCGTKFLTAPSGFKISKRNFILKNLHVLTMRVNFKSRVVYEKMGIFKTTFCHFFNENIIIFQEIKMMEL